MLSKGTHRHLMHASMMRLQRYEVECHEEASASCLNHQPKGTCWSSAEAAAPWLIKFKRVCGPLHKGFQRSRRAYGIRPPYTSVFRRAGALIVFKRAGALIAFGPLRCPMPKIGGFLELKGHLCWVRALPSFVAGGNSKPEQACMK